MSRARLDTPITGLNIYNARLFISCSNFISPALNFISTALHVLSSALDFFVSPWLSQKAKHRYSVSSVVGGVVNNVLFANRWFYGEPIVVGQWYMYLVCSCTNIVISHFHGDQLALPPQSWFIDFETTFALIPCIVVYGEPLIVG